MKGVLLTVLIMAAAITASAAVIGQAKSADNQKGGSMAVAGIYAEIDTEKGKIVCRLFEKESPKTVQNFVDLAEGKKEWLNPKTNKWGKTRFFDGLTFMRVIPGFMIQGGDPKNDCTGGPGYTFEDEFSSGLTFNKPGLLAMANAGPNTNGSQFFITDKGPRLPTHLNNHHTIFGEVVEGMDVVSAIAVVPADGGIAIKPVVIKSVKIIRK